MRKRGASTDGSTRSGGPLSGLSNRTLLAGLAIVASLVFFITAYTLTHFVEGLPQAVSVLFSLVLLSAIALAILIVGSLADIFRSSKAGLRGAKLHRRLVGLLSIVAVIPAIIAFVLSATVLRAFSDEYFVERVTEANLVSRDFANGYFNAESRKTGLQVVQLATDLARQAAGGLSPETAPIGFKRYLLGQSILRGFAGVTLVDRNGRIIAKVSAVQDMDYDLPPTESFLEISDVGATPYIFNALDHETLSAYYAMFRVDSRQSGYLDGGYLIVYIAENPALSEQLLGIRNFRDETKDVRERLAELSQTFAIGYGLVMVFLLLGAIWIGLLVANAIVGPVRRLATAAESVSSGDLTSRVDVRRGDGELGELGHAFNDMTEQLEAQRDDLIAANEQSDARRRFIETVVSGVPAGVLNVSPDGRIALSNPSADRILGRDLGRVTGLALVDVVPEVAPLFERAQLSTVTDLRDQIELERKGLARIINVRISPDDVVRRSSYVVTLDDITELVAAQRNAAWGDVARRIAHEIKNPLTPIQLSAERLKRKYAHRIEEDREIFDRCTDTIIRHVGDIGRMVNEFSSFARMPEPIMAKEDLCEIARSALFSFSVANPQINFTTDMPDEPVTIRCDGRLIGQAAVNLVKNAVESITESGNAENGLIAVSVRIEGDEAILDVADNGRGLPTEGRSRLTEPYMTTREKGTGLGLAIVRKAVEEHGGTFSLIDRGAEEGRGATARIALPVFRTVSTPQNDEPDEPAVTEKEKA
ncbi:PAS domain-containing sensor histidine kinase [Parvularcula sp. LCG005]|uniref:PAS domain-containing sensor histidine kinase n=1 Tax=Parvularcula sp. LCG005 TaxID=3078805 RepID=UPI002943AD99|nr:PAS domain-containing sensor histidine kinase [Parvularcula sp. LCG005]WOI54074.1 PAS domain-containing sensor histidine kinase [Parvularcula sp. LCG005]